MSHFLDKAYDRYAARQGGSTLSSHHKSLLSDPSLVEDYRDIMLQLPQNGAPMRASGDGSTNASVVIMSTPNTPERERKHGSVIMAADSPEEGAQAVLEPPLKHTILASDDGTQPLQTAGDAGTSGAAADGPGSASGESGNDACPNSSDYEDREEDGYGYSDSDFEECLEGSLKNLESDKSKRRILQKRNLITVTKPSREGKTLSSGFFKGNLHMYSDGSSSEEQEQESSDDELAIHPDEEEEDYQPLPPPQELDPGKLYALYAFQGPDPSHCRLEPDESCILLNDQDSYWWLVKRCGDGKIGFAPAEILETFPERLARLNCWKNENISTQPLSDTTQESSTDQSREPSQLKSYDEGNKSVSFNDVVSYAERYLQPSDSEECTASDDNRAEQASPHVDQIHEMRLNDHHLMDDDASDIVSDAAFPAMAPLTVKKTRSNNTSNDDDDLDDTHETDKNDRNSPAGSGSLSLLKPPLADLGPNHSKEDDLKQVFKAPAMPFSNGRLAEMPNSHSQNSISTIGEYSPSSSEYTNDSPQFDNEGKFIRETRSDSIPTARAIQDISRLVSSATDETLHNPSEDDQPQVSTPQASTPHASASSTDSTAELQANVTKTNSEESLLDTRQTDHNSLSSVTSSQSINKHDHHPVIHELYYQVFDKIDDLLERLERLRASGTK
ncbi:AaceriAER220Cp [[Ashbya] aceris (nom. inval.)]|nr:AaceriAER220Cp [[Ashbya] aceris (nom. inval.)]